MFNGAVNAFTGEAGHGTSPFDGQKKLFTEIAGEYKANGEGWIAVGDVNYGEGSSREHAAMCPRLMGAKAVITRSFARIHETNLKKQGVLPLTFVNPADYDHIEQTDRVALYGVKDLAPGSHVSMEITHADGSTVIVPLKHSLNNEQIDWFKAGSALNKIRKSL